jgi:hypothetical protein
MASIRVERRIAGLEKFTSFIEPLAKLSRDRITEIPFLAHGV